MIILRQKNFTYEYGYSGLSKKEENEKFSQLKGKDDRFNVYLGLKNGKSHKEAVDHVINRKY